MKKYLYIIPSLLTTVFLAFIVICGIYNFNLNSGLVVFICVLFFFPVLIHIIQTITAIFDAIRNKRLKWLLLLILLNIFVLPYYSNKYILNRIVLKNSVITYVITTLFLSALMGLYTLTLVGKNISRELVTSDHKAEFPLDNNWKEKKEDGYSLYAQNEKKGIAFGVLTYNMDMYETYTVDNILEDQKNYLAKKLESMVLYKDEITVTLNDRNIKTIEYKVKDKNEDKYSIYVLSVIEFNDNSNYVLYIFEKISEINYEKYDLDLRKVVNDVRLK